MKNALQLLNSYLRISETFIWNQLSTLSRYRPIVLASEITHTETFPLPNGVILPIPPVKSALGSLLAKWRNRFAEMNYTPCQKELSDFPPAVIHAHYGYRAIVSLGLVKKTGVPLVVNFYGYDLSDRDYLRRARGQYRQMFELASAFLVEGPAMREKLAALGCPEPKIHLQPISIIPSRYEFHPREWDGNKTLRFLFVGRLVEKKGLMTALEALRLLRSPFAWELSVVGDGPGMAQARTFAETYGMSASVKFLGPVDPGDLPKILSTHDILIQPSQKAMGGDSEGGAPTVLLEAQASGMPIIATTHDDIPHVVSADKNAYLSEERDAPAMVRNIMRLVENSAGWNEMAQTGLDNIRSRHDVTKLTAQLESIYDSVL